MYAFGSMDHAKLLAIMENLGFPLDTIEIVGDIYANSRISFHVAYFGTTPLVHISRGAIQGNTPSSCLFNISQTTTKMARKWIPRLPLKHIPKHIDHNNIHSQPSTTH